MTETDVLTLAESEVAALLDLSSGKIDGAAAAQGPLANLVQRGLAKVEEGDIAFSEEMEDAFRPLATCQYNLLVLDAQGNSVDQYYVGEEDSAARVFLADAGMSFEAVDSGRFVNAVAASVLAHLESAQPAKLPDPENFESAGLALGFEGLQPQAWCSLLITTDVLQGSDPDAAYSEWVLVVRTEPGIIFQDPGRNILAMLNTEEELAGMIYTLLPQT